MTQAKTLIGTDVKTIKDKSGKAFGEEMYKTAQQEGKITEVSYMFPRPGETEPVQKISYVTRVGDIGCGVGYYKWQRMAEKRGAALQLSGPSQQYSRDQTAGLPLSAARLMSACDALADLHELQKAGFFACRY